MPRSKEKFAEVILEKQNRINPRGNDYDKIPESIYEEGLFKAMPSEIPVDDFPISFW